MPDPNSEKFTKGPWSYGEMKPRTVGLKRKHWAVGVNGGQGVALAFGDNEANAALIAAAPTMFAELEADLEAFQKMQSLSAVTPQWVDFLQHRIDCIKLILSKARGL